MERSIASLDHVYIKWGRGGFMARAIFVLILLASATVGSAQGSDPFGKKSQGRLSSGLNRLVVADERGDVKSLNAAGVQIERGLRVVRVVIEVEDWSAAAGVRGAVERAGGRVDAAAKPLLRATVPIDRLRALSETSGVKRVREPYRPKPKEVVSEGCACDRRRRFREGLAGQRRRRFGCGARHRFQRGSSPRPR
jgi:hypothetical protein